MDRYDEGDDDDYTRGHEPGVRLNYNRGPNYERSNDELNPHNVLPSIGASYSPDYDDGGRYDYNDDDEFYNDDGDAKRMTNRTTRDNGKDDNGDELDEIEEKKKLKALEEEEERLRRKQVEEEERRRKIAERVKTPSPTRRQNTSERDVEYTRTLSKIEALRTRRHEIEKQRDRLVRHAKSLQQDYFHKRHDARDAWKKKYFEEKKKTQPKEELFSELREKLHECHRKEMLQLETAKEAARDAVKRGEMDRDIIEKANLKLHVTKLKNDIEELSTQLQNTKMRLTAEMKLRNQSENELRTMKRDKAMSLNNFYAKDDSMPIPKTNGHHSPRREKQVPPRDQEPQSFKSEKKPSFAIRKDPPRYRPEPEVNFDDDFYDISRRSPPPAVPVPASLQPRPQPKLITDDPECQQCGSKKKTKDEPDILKVRDESDDHEVKDQPDIFKNSDKDDTTNNLHVTCPNCGHWGDKKKKHWRPNHGHKHPWEEISCPECKGYLRHWRKRCRCGRRHKKEHRTSRKRCDHCETEKNKSGSRSSNSRSSSSSSRSSKSSSSSSSSSDSDSDDSRSSEEKKRRKRGHKKRKHRKDCPCRHGNKPRDKKRDKKKKSDKGAQPDKPEKDDDSYERKNDPPPEKEFRLQEQEDRKSDKNDDSNKPEFELQPKSEQFHPKPTVRKIKAGSRSPKLAKKAGKVDPFANQPKGRPYRPGDLDDAFRTFASRAGGKEATNADIVKWCTDAEILGKNLTTQHIDISFSKVKPKGSKTIARKDMPALIEHMAFKYKDDHRMDMQQAKRQISEKLANAPFMLHSITNALKAGAVERLTDTTKYTGMHKNRFDETGKGKGNEGLVNYEGYVTNYRMAGTYDQRH